MKTPVIATYLCTLLFLGVTSFTIAQTTCQSYEGAANSTSTAMKLGQAVTMNGCEGDVFHSFSFSRADLTNTGITATLSIYNGESVASGDKIYEQTGISIQDVTGFQAIEIGGGTCIGGDTTCLEFASGSQYTFNIEFSASPSGEFETNLNPYSGGAFFGNDFLISSYDMKFKVATALLPTSNIGIGTSKPDPSALLEMQSTDKGLLIPRMTTSQRENIEAPANGLMVFDTTTDTFWFFSSSGWDEIRGADADADPANEIQSLSLNGDTIFLSKSNFIVVQGLANVGQLYVNPSTVQERLNAGESPTEIASTGIALDSLYGKIYQGGYIFFVDYPDMYQGFDGLVAALADQVYSLSYDLQWGCYQTDLSGSDGIIIGTGKQNTLDIVSSCQTTGIAARVADDYFDGTYSDWFLPSRDELILMYERLQRYGCPLDNNPCPTSIGEFKNAQYWSSSETTSLTALIKNFSNGGDFGGYKNGTNHVRAVRTF